MAQKRDRIGLWMIGGCGRVGSAVALGQAALARKRVEPLGMVTALKPFSGLKLVSVADLVIGGHEIQAVTLVESIRQAHQAAGLFDEHLIEACLPDLRRAQKNMRPGTTLGVAASVKKQADRDVKFADRSPAAIVERLKVDLVEFRTRHKLAHVVVVNLASCEPEARRYDAHRHWDMLCKALARRGSKVLPASTLYALAAVEAGCTYINFTPSLGINVPAILQRADALGAAYMGKDGKTGETLVKSVLAPLFATRNLAVRSWAGHNILGNPDGAVLNDPKNKSAKLASKGGTLQPILGYPVDAPVSIQYVASLDDWKVAWDFIHFEGFLNTKMSMQFTWQGCDSALAAPLILDLTRLAARAYRLKQTGPLTHLACFFKEPMGVTQRDHASGWQRLVSYASSAGSL